MIRNKRLWVRAGGTNYGYYLHTNKLTIARYASLGVRAGNETLYCPLVEATSTDKLRIRGSNRVLAAGNYTPTLRFQVNLSYTTGSYGYNTTMEVRDIVITFGYGVSISKQIQIKAQTTGNSNVLTLATMNAGATSASDGSANSFSPGASTPAATYYIYIGGSLATSISVPYTGGWVSKSYDIPTSYW